MPSSSPEQRKTMRAIAKGWKPPASADIHIPQNVAEEFFKADQAKAKREGRDKGGKSSK